MNKKQANISIICAAKYDVIVEVPENYTLEETIDYARKNINSFPIDDLTYIIDSDKIDDENCYFLEEED